MHTYSTTTFMLVTTSLEHRVLNGLWRADRMILRLCLYGGKFVLRYGTIKHRSSVGKGDLVIYSVLDLIIMFPGGPTGCYCGRTITLNWSFAVANIPTGK